MRAKVGEEILVDGPRLGDPRRSCEVLEVRNRGDVIRYRVRWDDGHESIFFPGSDAHVVHSRRRVRS